MTIHDIIIVAQFSVDTCFCVLISVNHKFMSSDNQMEVHPDVPICSAINWLVLHNDLATPMHIHLMKWHGNHPYHIF